MQDWHWEQPYSWFIGGTRGGMCPRPSIAEVDSSTGCNADSVEQTSTGVAEITLNDDRTPRYPPRPKVRLRLAETDYLLRNQRSWTSVLTKVAISYRSVGLENR